MKRIKINIPHILLQGWMYTAKEAFRISILIAITRIAVCYNIGQGYYLEFKESGYTRIMKINDNENFGYVCDTLMKYGYMNHEIYMIIR